ncbi:MAG: hypothetical protein IKJ14_00055, partial [Clostridia bacterium]|nr:hypothetical protein [Clostridia bacterium]
TVELNCYGEVEIGVIAREQLGENVTLSSDSDLISINGTKVEGKKIGEGAIVNVTYEIGGKVYTKQIVVNVVNPFKVFVDGAEYTGKIIKEYNEEMSITVKYGDTVLDNVTLTESNVGLTIDGSTVKFDKIFTETIVTATFTYGGDEHSFEISLGCVDTIAKEAIVKVNGTQAGATVGFNISEESEVTVEYNGTQGEITSINIDSDKFEVNGSKVTAKDYATANMFIVFTYDGTSHNKAVAIETTYETFNVSDSVSYDADEAQLDTTIEGDILKAVVTYAGEETILTSENGGIVGGKLVGVPTINNASAVKTFSVDIYTSVGVYAIDEVVYYTYIIENADEYLEALTYADYDTANHSAYVAAVAKEESARTPDEQALVDAWAERYAIKDGIYVLANDIDLSGKTIRNDIGGINAPHWSPLPAVVKAAAFTGLFDGQGYTVSNATINTNMYHDNVVSRLASTGLFPTVKTGAIIKNVAYVNVSTMCLSNKDNATWTGVFTDRMSGYVENVYLDVAPTSNANAGFAVEIDGTMKNVLINYPFEFDYDVASADYTMRSLYGFVGVGSLGGYLSASTGTVENVIVVSKMPLNYNQISDAKAMPSYDKESANIDYFYYADNETELWFNHTVNGAKTFDELIAENGKARRFSGVRRYDSLDLVAKDSDANVQAFTETGLFKLVNGNLVWHNVRLSVANSDAIDYEASSGTVNSTALNSIEGIEKIVVNGVELTEANGGFKVVDGKVILTQRPDAESTIAGVPYISKITTNNSQELEIIVYTKDVAYTFNNVTFWTEIFTSGAEFDEKYDYGAYDAEKTYARHEGYYALGNDIDMAGLTVENHVNYAHKQDLSLVGAGLKGVFDGRGYAIHNATLELGSSSAPSTGFFGTTFEGSIVQNVALINLTVKTNESIVTYRSWSGILTGNNYDILPSTGNPASYNMVGTIKNVYVDVNSASTSYYAGLVGKVDDYYRTNLENVVLNHPTATYNYEGGTTNRTRTLFGDDGLGSLFGKGGTNNGVDITNSQIKNVYAIAPIPVAAIRGVSGYSLNMDSTSNDYFYYGANESKVWYNHTVNGDKTFAELAQENGKVRVLQGVRRYDNMAGFTADNSPENQAMAEALTATGYFKLVDGQLLWHTQKANVISETAIDYDASTGKVDTTAIDWENVKSIAVGSEILTLENGGIIKNENGTYSLRAKESLEDSLPGVPFADNTTVTPDQALTFVVDTEEKTYTFNNVTYWSAIINSAVDFKTYVEFDPGSKRFGSEIYNKGFYKLGANIDFADDGNGERVVIDYYGRDAADGGYIMYNAGKTGFAGVFDGAGHVMDNFQPTQVGLFGCLSSYNINSNGPVIKNFALTNVDMSNNTNAITVNLLAKGMYDDGVVDTIENVYIQIDANSVMRTGIIPQPQANLKMNNVYIEYAKDKIATTQPFAFDKNYADTDGKVYVTHNTIADNYALVDSSVLFHAIDKVYQADSTITNVFVASPQPLTANFIAVSGYYGFMYSHDATNKTHTLMSGGLSPNRIYFAYGANETRGYVPVIKEMKPAFVEISKLDGYIDNTVKTGFFCNVCHEPYATGASGDACTATADCQGTLVGTSYLGLWGDVRSYVWTFHDLTGFVNQPLSETNAIWMFSGIKKYDTPALMAAAGNDYSSFTGATGNGCWKVVDGALTWANA